MTDAVYDPRFALPSGVLMTRDIEAGLVAAFDGTDPITPDQAIAIAGPSPPYPVSLPRFVDSNPDAWGNAIDAPGEGAGW